MNKKYFISCVLILLCVFLTACAYTDNGEETGTTTNPGTTEESASISEPPAGALTAVNIANEQAISRVEFIMLWAEQASANLSDTAWLNISFTDVTEESNCYDALCFVYNKGIIPFTRDRLFRPDDAISREEAAVFLKSYLDYLYTDLPGTCGTGAPGMDNISEEAKNAVSCCWAYGIIEDDGEGRVNWDFRPADPVTADQAKSWILAVQNLSCSAVSAPSEHSFADSLILLTENDGNRMLSPYSAKMCLAMLANGAVGNTRDELLAALQIGDLDSYNNETAALLERYDTYAPVITLNTCNSIWLNQSRFGTDSSFLPTFSENMQNYYSAEVKEVTDDNSVENVNAWANEKTLGKISDILSDEHRRFTTALINAVYFKATWENQFEESATAKGNFTNSDGSVSEVDFMHQTDDFGYYSTPGTEILELDYSNCVEDGSDSYAYAKGANFSMYFILSDETPDIEYLLNNAKCQNSLVRVTIPKFEITYSITLDEILQLLGVQTAYDPYTADLSGMIDLSSLSDNLFLGTVMQKTYISVDESGTEAAAVTVAVAVEGAAPPQPVIREFTADKPFWFAVRDNTSGEILFAGKYETAK